MCAAATERMPVHIRKHYHRHCSLQSNNGEFAQLLLQQTALFDIQSAKNSESQDTCIQAHA
jgi:hypothetical protein